MTTPDEMRAALLETRQALARILRGKENVIEFSLAAILAGGHILLEGPPGTGKTSLARGIARAFGGDFHRIQLTSDLLPSDIVGFLRIRPGSSEFEFRKGPIFTNFLLADELNRSNPKTQSALLEAMAEGTVSVDGVTYPLPQPFFVVATQNPLEFQGVYPLAESQLDRFMLLLPFDFPAKEDELEIYRRLAQPGGEDVRSLLTLPDLQELKRQAALVEVHTALLEYINQIVRASREIPEVSCGGSVRSGLHLISAAKALAFLRGRDFVTPLEVEDLLVPALAHRLRFIDGADGTARKREAVAKLLKKLPPPR